jgi:FMN-dependent NADH-azoreductase
MATLLHLRASSRGAASHSRRIGQMLVSRLQDAADIAVVDRDLAQKPPPHPDQGFVAASLMAEAERGAGENAALALSETLIAELEHADLVVIDTPMHNFTVPSGLKAWIDHVVRPRRTFRSTAAGKIGLLRERPVFVVVACGGPFSDDETAQTDFLTPYLRYVLATIGLRDVRVLRLENLNRGAAALGLADARAQAWITEQVTAWRKFSGEGEPPYM